jgi:alpha-glucosidase
MAELKWWQKAVFYQIYPQSFADGNGDGIGDLPGVIEKLDYLQDLGIDAIWMSPHYPSPMVDCGYDISNYTEVAPEYGTIDDFQRFLDGAHRRGIRVILDLVLNHTSDQHTWFIESRSSRDNPRNDWYIWRDPVDGGPPNNWLSTFGGPAWEYEPKRGQYFYHFFFKEQPDLNWRNPEVRQAMFNAVRFWYDLGVDGFRIDAIGTVFEREDMPNHLGKLTPEELFYNSRFGKQEYPPEVIEKEYKATFGNQVDQTEMIGLLRELRKVNDEYPDRMLIGESEKIEYCADDMLHMVFNFNLMRTRQLTPKWVRQNQEERLAELVELACPEPGAWPCNTLGNHDSPRVKNSFGDGKHDDDIARLHLSLMLTLKGTPFIYNGEEIGMTDLLLDDIRKFRDTLGVWYYELCRSGLGLTEEVSLDIAAHNTRDKNRTPFQWKNAVHAGFCPSEIEPWLPVNPNYKEGVNVEEQESNQASLLSYYRKVIHLRKANPALIEGEYIPVHEEAQDYLAFLRRSAQQTCLVVLNMSGGSYLLEFTAPGSTMQIPEQGKLLFSSRDRPTETINLTQAAIAPWEVLIVEL